MHILADIFPAHFSGTAASNFPDVYALNSITTNVPKVVYLSTTRVVVTETHVTVAQDSPDGAQIVFHEPYSQLIRPEERDGTFRVVTPTGKFLAFQKDTACGCGSRLRSWNPYRTLNSINDPTE